MSLCRCPQLCVLPLTFPPSGFSLHHSSLCPSSPSLGNWRGIGHVGRECFLAGRGCVMVIQVSLSLSVSTSGRGLATQWVDTGALDSVVSPASRSRVTVALNISTKYTCIWYQLIGLKFKRGQSGDLQYRGSDQQGHSLNTTSRRTWAAPKSSSRVAAAVRNSRAVLPRVAAKEYLVFSRRLIYQPAPRGTLQLAAGAAGASWDVVLFPSKAENAVVPVDSISSSKACPAASKTFHLVQ